MKQARRIETNFSFASDTPHSRLQASDRGEGSSRQHPQREQNLERPVEPFFVSPNQTQASTSILSSARTVPGLNSRKDRLKFSGQVTPEVKEKVVEEQQADANVDTIA